MRPMCSFFCVLVLVANSGAAEPAESLQPIPDRLVVLTFDDASRSHFTIARPILKQYGFGATFFITEGWDFGTNKQDFMRYLALHNYHVIALRDLVKYVDPMDAPQDHLEIINVRRRQLDQ